MIKLIQVIIGFSESPDHKKPKTFESLREANSYLRRLKPPVLGYYKTDFKLRFANGNEYGGRFDVGADAPTIEEHIKWLAESPLVQAHSENKRRYDNFFANYEL